MGGTSLWLKPQMAWPSAQHGTAGLRAIAHAADPLWESKVGVAFGMVIWTNDGGECHKIFSRSSFLMNWMAMSYWRFSNWREPPAFFHFGEQKCLKKVWSKWQHFFRSFVDSPLHWETSRTASTGLVPWATWNYKGWSYAVRLGVIGRCCCVSKEQQQQQDAYTP